MLGFIIAFRNFVIAVVLAWIGMDALPSDGGRDAPADQTPAERHA
ncbi:MAG: hypothetical protein AAFY34_15025 [Pseudomonadota bacterium]